MTKEKLTILSGIQTSGQLILGNYIGAISHWAKMQSSHDCLFMLADLHTLTVKQDPKALRERCYDFLALYIACGIDPDQNILFAQSQVPAHTQLAWILSCYTQMGELNRMTQFKDKSLRHAHNINAGLFSYPVLMAADILLYKADLVPVGEDQKQHLELTRDLALRFNHYYGEIFTVPEPYIPPQGARIMSLQDPMQKMSKSDSNENSYIALLDPPTVILNKFKRAVTDSDNEVRLDPAKPGVSNLLTILAVMTNSTIPELETIYKTSGYGKFKTAVAEAVIEKLQPIQAHYKKLRADQSQLQQLLKTGAEHAQQKSQPLLQAAKHAVGLITEDF